MGTRRTKPAISHVSIVSSNAETLDGLQNYFSNVGVAARCTRAIKNFDAIAAEHVTVAVIFPDDYVRADVIALVRKLRRSRPHFLAILITREPQQFAAVTDTDGFSPAPVLLPKPSFGWDILDAIRAHASRGQA
jgi:DNA-binding NtrC family response regulator